MKVPDFANGLYPVKNGAELDRGAVVYERVTTGGQHRYHKLRVLSTMRGAARCERVDGSKSAFVVKYNELFVERTTPETASVRSSSSARSASAPLSGQAPAAAPATPAQTTTAGLSPASDDQVDAWLDMGAELVQGIAGELASLEQTAAKLEGELDAIDQHHRGVIQALEQELLEAKRAHEEDRALAATRRDDVARKLARKRERKALLERLQGLK